MSKSKKKGSRPRPSRKKSPSKKSDSDSALAAPRGKHAPISRPIVAANRSIPYGSGPAMLAFHDVGGTEITAGVTKISAMLPQSPERAAAAEAALLEMVLGRDERERVRNTHQYPNRCICLLEFQTADFHIGHGTGWLASDRTVITAGHCLYLHDYDGWVKKVSVYPARDGDLIPLAVQGVEVMSTRGWVEERDPYCDYGAIRLDQPVPYGAFGFGVASEEVLESVDCHVVGYPGDKKGAERFTQWGHNRKITDATDEALIYQTDTIDGNSGGPVYVRRGKKADVVGIHNYGDVSGNSATRITDDVYRNLKIWSAAD